MLARCGKGRYGRRGAAAARARAFTLFNTNAAYQMDQTAKPATLSCEFPGSFAVGDWYTNDWYTPFWGDADRWRTETC